MRASRVFEVKRPGSIHQWTSDAITPHLSCRLPRSSPCYGPSRGPACSRSPSTRPTLTWSGWRGTIHRIGRRASNNHVLNSLLMRLFTSVFGVSHLSVRAPALLGAALYIRRGVPALPEADAGPARAMAGVRLPGVQPVRLRPPGSRARIRAGARIPDVHVRRGGVHAAGCAGLRRVLRLRGAFLRRQLLVRIRQRFRDVGDFDLGLRPHAGDPGTRPAAGRVCAAGTARVGLSERSGGASLAERPTGLRSALAARNVLHGGAGVSVPAQSADRESHALPVAGIREAVSVAGAAGAGGVAMGEAAAGCLPGAARHPGGHDRRALAVVEIVPRAAADGSDGDLDRAPVRAGHRGGAHPDGARSP